MGCPLQESAHGDERIVATCGHGGTVVLNPFFIHPDDLPVVNVSVGASRLLGSIDVTNFEGLW